MSPEPPPEVQSALQLLRRGRFAETVQVLQQLSPSQTLRRRNGPFIEALLADALQRTGCNDDAESIARRHLQDNQQPKDIQARLNFVMGNVLRERGDLATAIRHLQIAASQATEDFEFSCWAHLRLLTTVAEHSGLRTAIARIDDVRRVLARAGDARPFAAMHLWHVETETLSGALDSARRHLKIASSLLATIDDVWLHGYLAINSSVLHYYSAEVAEARRCAEAAIDYARHSGHRTTRRAAFTNLGYFEFANGHLVEAEEYFELALQCCEHGSSNEIAILDNIAESKLERGDFDGCRSILSQLDALATDSHDALKRHYSTWTLQTHIRLLLREGREAEAKRLIADVQAMLKEMPEARLSAESRLLAAEALLATEPSAAADTLSPIFSSCTQLAPDLFAEFERVNGKALRAAGSVHLAQIHFERAATVFGAIGHCLGRERSLQELPAAEEPDLSSILGIDVTLDRFRSLLDMRTRPELFGREAIALLHDLKCSDSAELTITTDPRSAPPQNELSEAKHSCLQQTRRISIALGTSLHKTVTLTFAPLDDLRSRLVALSFQRVITQFLAFAPSHPADELNDVAWTLKDNTPVEQGAVFASEAMLSVLRTVKQIAPTDISVLITGETGTGKEIVARTIHEHSRRAVKHFIGVNCASVPRDLIESQLFGHRKGAFSGATENYQGIVRAANGGTLFLDEIGEIPLEVQTKLLRFLEMNEVHPVGESQPIKVNVRLIFATNGDLEDAVNHNRFRRDLFYRLNVIPIRLPPLRERREEIPILANVFAHRFGSELSKEPLSFSADAMEHLIFYEWPGNIRQLANEIRRLAAVLDSGGYVKPDHLSRPLKDQRLVSGPRESRVPHLVLPIEQSLEKATEELEAEMIKHALNRTNGRVGEAAARLGISRKGLYLKRLRLGLTHFSSQPIS
jgi:DNA-binding NtrC family response regulator/tetratricopeptide (TPR) repeat protein